MKRDDLVTIRMFYSVQKANMYRSILETNGIRAYLSGDIATEVMPIGGDIYIELQVPAEEENKARRILASEFDKEEFEERTNI